jgi:rfaE bifunctional protein kinase chain/domain
MATQGPSLSSREIVGRFGGQRVLVIGDVMLDEFVYGDVRRISPEAPVPILEVRERVLRPGGAANVAMNIASLGGSPTLIGIIGSDDAGHLLQQALAEFGVDASELVVDPARPTTRKTRIVAGTQQVVRIDAELRTPAQGGVEQDLLARLEDALNGMQSCVISDYDKGTVTWRVCEAAIHAAAAQKAKTIVDPKGADYLKYRSASVVTPNLPELAHVLGAAAHSPAEQLLTRASQELLPILEGSALLVTRGAAGMSLLRLDEAPRHWPTFASSVFDVTGAGDTVVATLAMGLASGASLEDAIPLANHAAGIVVRKPGTASVTKAELSEVLHGSHPI